MNRSGSIIALPPGGMGGGGGGASFNRSGSLAIPGGGFLAIPGGATFVTPGGVVGGAGGAGSTSNSQSPPCPAFLPPSALIPGMPASLDDDDGFNILYGISLAQRLKEPDILGPRGKAGAGLGAGGGAAACSADFAPDGSASWKITDEEDDEGMAVVCDMYMWSLDLAKDVFLCWLMAWVSFTIGKFQVRLLRRWSAFF